LLITGIGAADIAKLKSSGICTVYAVQATTKRNLSKIKGLSDAKVDKIKEAVCKIFVPNPRPPDTITSFFWSLADLSVACEFLDGSGSFGSEKGGV
jgi:hypothetical protein